MVDRLPDVDFVVLALAARRTPRLPAPASARPTDLPPTKRIERLLRVCAGLVLAAAGAEPAHADREVQAILVASGSVAVAALLDDRLVRAEPDDVAFEAGQFDAVKGVRRAAAFGAEYRPGGIVWWKLRPFAGAGFTSDRSLYGYGGIRLVTHWGEHVVITPSFAIGGYRRGGGKDLGNPPLVGRSGLEFEYAFAGEVRLGLAYHHLSNGKALGQAVNPGTEIVGLTVSAPLR